ncbi:MAG TPA: hypothetical protein VF732_03360 [Nitrospira sp.]
MPHALPMSGQHALVTIEPRSEHWEGWSDDEIAQIPTRDPSIQFPPGFVPGTRIVVRHHRADVPVPLLVAEEAFADWVDPLFTEAEKAERRAKRAEWAASGIAEMKTVVALSRFFPRSAHPRGEDITAGWLRAEFRRALTDFNGVLDALGFVLGRWDVGAIELRDLPAEVPVLVGATQRLSDGRPAGITFTAQMHDAFPVFPEHFSPDLQSTEEAVELTNRARHGDEPYMFVYRFLHTAERERLAGDTTRALIDLNTAVELMLAITLERGGPIVGFTADEQNGAAQAGAKNKVAKYLAKLLAEEIDIDDPGTAWGAWFTGGYKLRNDAIHEGIALDRQLVERAFGQGWGALAELKTKLEGRSSLKKLGGQFAVDLGRQPDPAGDPPLGFSFPWD